MAVAPKAKDLVPNTTVEFEVSEPEDIFNRLPEDIARGGIDNANKSIFVSPFRWSRFMACAISARYKRVSWSSIFLLLWIQQMTNHDCLFS